MTNIQPGTGLHVDARTLSGNLKGEGRIKGRPVKLGIPGNFKVDAFEVVTMRDFRGWAKL